MRAKDYSPESMAEVILNILQYPESIREMSDAQMRQRHQNLQSTQIKKLLEVYNSVIA
jgi:UDP-N-acetylglucosamine:LPS N-acetylglucosamine transferase